MSLRPTARDGVYSLANRQIENKSKLVFEFNLGEASNLIRTLHFMENIDINESVQTNYSEYTPLGNNGSIFTYLGAKSRNIDITFNITLPNIQAHTLIKPPVESGATRVTKEDYTEALKTLEASRVEKSKQNVERFIQQYINNVLADPYDTNIHVEEFGESTIQIQSAADIIRAGYQAGAGADTRLKSLMQVMYWVNLIRSSTMTHSTQPSLGPPIVRLVHGIMYQNVPCIVTDYAITHDTNAGYDETTYLPKVLKIKLSLREVRQRGASFDNSVPDNQDMMPGWESFAVQGFATLDPMNKVSDTGERSSI